jgi:hypothetical protein
MPLGGRRGRACLRKTWFQPSGRRLLFPGRSRRKNHREHIKRQSKIRHCSDIGNYCQQQHKDRTAKTILDQLSRLFTKKRPTISRDPCDCSVDGTRDLCVADLERQGSRNPGDCSVDATPAAPNAPTAPPASSKPATPAASNAPTTPLDETDRDAAIMSVAAKRHGVATRTELVEAGVPAHAIDYRVERRRLHRLYRGVYRVGTMEANCEKGTAAVLACGEAAVLSHRSAAWLWTMLPLPSGREMAIGR